MTVGCDWVWRITRFTYVVTLEYSSSATLPRRVDGLESVVFSGIAIAGRQN